MIQSVIEWSILSASVHLVHLIHVIPFQELEKIDLGWEYLFYSTPKQGNWITLPPSTLLPLLFLTSKHTIRVTIFSSENWHILSNININISWTFCDHVYRLLLPFVTNIVNKLELVTSKYKPFYHFFNKYVILIYVYSLPLYMYIYKI